MKIFKTGKRIIIQTNDLHYGLETNNWDKFVNRADLREKILAELKHLEPLHKDTLAQQKIFDPPIGSQEVWAAGVTYLRSKVEREKEAEGSGGAQFYDTVYEADRPELFFKANPYRVTGNGSDVYIRRDSDWNVPEPELTLFLSSAGTIEGYTIGNDLSSRSIEGENPLYLPQAKTWDHCAVLGPCLYLPENGIKPETAIKMQIIRNSEIVFEGSTSIRKMKRTFDELVEYLFRECTFPSGCYLMTGTGIVPPDSFTLQPKDLVVIEIDEIGRLNNVVSFK